MREPLAHKQVSQKRSEAEHCVCMFNSSTEMKLNESNMLILRLKLQVFGEEVLDMKA